MTNVLLIIIVCLLVDIYQQLKKMNGRENKNNE